MVGVRIAPDDNDIVVWKLDESAAPFVNSSTSTNAPSHAVSDLATLSGTVFLQQPGPFGAASSVLFTGNNSGSPRNHISGANNFQPQPPLTFSCWFHCRQYNTTGFTQHGVSKQHTTGVWSGSTFTSIIIASNRTYASQPSLFDWYVNTGIGQVGGAVLSPTDHTIPLNAWCHVGLTYDGTTVIGYLNGNIVGSVTATPTGNITYGGGPWFIGAIPSGSGNPEESTASFCDIRIANIVRPQSYFANVYNNARYNPGSQISVVTRFYKMRAYNIQTNIPEYWVDSSISYTLSTSSTGAGLGPIEVVESWNALNV